MKKLTLLFTFLLLLTLYANAQYVGKIPTKDSNGTVVTSDGSKIQLDDLNYARLIQTQNKLLNRRKTALIITSAGCGTGLVGLIISGNTYGDTPRIGGIVTTIGTATILTGGVWLIVNEFKLIDNKRSINELTLKSIPGGIALQF